MAAHQKADLLAGKDSLKSVARPPIEPGGENTKVLRQAYATRAHAKWKRLMLDTATFAITLAKDRACLFLQLPVTVRGFKVEIDNSGFVTTLNRQIKPTV